MSTPQDENRSYLLRLWIPALVLGGLIGVLILAALTSGEPTRTVPIAVGVVITVIMFISTRSRKKRQIARMLQVPAPDWFVRSSTSGRPDPGRVGFGGRRKKQRRGQRARNHAGIHQEKRAALQSVRRSRHRAGSEKRDDGGFGRRES